MRLENGQRFPELGVDLVGGDRIELPEDLTADWSVVLVYRGHW